MKFQNISVHGSKVMLCTRKRDERTNKQTSQRQYAPPTFFKVGGIKTDQTVIIRLEVSLTTPLKVYLFTFRMN